MLKLLSGLMMLSLGLVLLLAPEALNSPVTALGLIAAALAGTALLARRAGRGRRDSRHGAAKAAGDKIG